MPTILLKELAVILASYALGCVATGYYLVRLRTGQDLRRMGSGSTGGTNVSRVLGKPWLVATGLADCFKGLAALGLARYFGLEPWATALVVAAVVAGHVFPIQLGFRGGKGLSTVLGALLVYDYPLLVVCLPLIGLLWWLSKQRTLSLMAVVAATPVAALLLQRAPVEAGGLALTALIIVAAHRRNIAAALKDLQSRRRAPG